MASTADTSVDKGLGGGGESFSGPLLLEAETEVM